MKKAKLIGVILLIGLAIVVVLQNTQLVETRFLFVTMTMPRAALLGITLLVGVAIGILVSFGLTAKKPSNDKE